MTIFHAVQDGRINAALSAASAIGLLSLQILLGAEVARHETPWVEPQEESQLRWDPLLVRIFSFGHLQATVDWLWMRTISDPRISHVAPGSHPRMYYELDLATDLDPHFEELYRIGASLIAIVRNDGPGARDLLLKADRYIRLNLPDADPGFRSRYWQRSWLVYLYLAYVQLFELQDLPSAAEAFRTASSYEDAPAYLSSLVARLQKPGGQYEVGLRLLRFLRNEAKDEKLQKEYDSKLRSLTVAADLDHWNRKLTEFLERTRLPRSAENARRTWNEFVRSAGFTGVDSLGGRLELNDETGRITTTSPYQKVFGLD